MASEGYQQAVVVAGGFRRRYVVPHLPLCRHSSLYSARVSDKTR
jgi:hypothetical protein